MRFANRALPVLMAALAICWAAGADDNAQTRSVEGSVTDAAKQPVVGAVVQLKDTKTLQIRSFYTQAGGAYHFAGLSANSDYEIKAQHGGLSSATKTLSSFDSHKVATINLTLKEK